MSINTWKQLFIHLNEKYIYREKYNGIRFLFFWRYRAEGNVVLQTNNDGDWGEGGLHLIGMGLIGPVDEY